MLIVTSNYQILYGINIFINKFGFIPNDILASINLNDNNIDFEKNIIYKNNNYNVICKFINEIYNVKQWIIEIDYSTNINNNDIKNSNINNTDINNSNINNTDINNIDINSDSKKNNNFMSYILHEVRNYLNIISISNDNMNTIIQKNKNIYEQSYFIELSNELKSSTDTITDIINDILISDKLNKNCLTLNKNSCLLFDLFNKSVNTFLLKLNNSDKKIDFTYENKAGNISIIIDYTKIKQVILNLLFNALKFTNFNGKINFVISTELKESIKYIKFEIIDNGIGIDEKYKKNIFLDYQQITPELLQNNNGMGLGLSISKKIVQLHDGIIGFESKLNVGTNFYFYIPMLIQCTKPISSISTNKLTCPRLKKYKINQTNIDITKHKILIVEDNIIIQKLVKKMLLDINIKNLFIANNGLEALNIYKEEYNKNNPFTLILMDQEMPVMDGNLSSKHILEIDNKAIIIGITGNTNDEFKNKFIKYGVFTIFEKPITKEKLISILHKHYRY